MMRGIAEWHVFIPNEAFLVAKSARVLFCIAHLCTAFVGNSQV